MLTRRVGAEPTPCPRPHLSILLAGALAAVVVPASSALAQTPLPPVSIGGGLQTSFIHSSPEEGDGQTEFVINSARLYVNGSATEKIKFMFNTEFDGGTNHIGVLDAVARIELKPEFNLWFGRFLPPSDRANLYGPYYSHHWSVFTDGVQDGYPFVSAGRDNGVAYWGDFGKVKVSAGAFDGESATGNTDVLTAARIQVNFWDKEDGYYLNGTYYGGKNLLSVGAAVQAQSGDTAATLDFLMERKIGSGGSFSIESEYANYDKLGGYSADYGKNEGGYFLASYLFPEPVGIGKIEILGKFAKAYFSNGLTVLDPDYDQTTTEINFNYLIKEFNARLMFFFKDTSFSDVRQDFKQFGVGLQIQM